jgi:putative ABC transport system permease protein
MSLLDHKLRRDLWALKSQVLAVALVMACGLAMMVMTRSLIRSLDTARDTYYQENRFAHVFAGLKRAPAGVADRLRAIPGVVAVEPGVTVSVTLDVPGLLEPARALVSSLPEGRDPALNRVHLRAGRLLRPETHHEVLVGEAFAEAHGIQPSDTLAVILNGRRVELRIAGIVLAPQYVFEAPPGAALPDNRSFAVLWMNERELAEAYQLDGAFNTVALALGPGASEPAIIAAVDRLLEPYGGLGAYGREDHPSNVRVSDEIRVLTGLSFGFPLVFLSVGAFMVHAVMSRQIALQREQVAILKAFGFGPGAIAAHFIKFALVIVALGLVLGTAAGMLLGQRLVDLFHLFFRFPRLEFLPSWGALASAGAASVVAALIGVASAVRRVLRLAPAEAMRPEPPASFRPALVERTRWAGWFSVSARMALRNLERKPVQALLTTLALAAATGILIIPNAVRDGINHILDFQWDVVQRQTVSVNLVEPGPARVIADFRALPGVVHAEPYRVVEAELVAGSRSRRLGVSGLPPGGHLHRVIDAHGRRIVLPPQGLVLSSVLGEALGVGPGDALTLRVLQGTRPTREVRVAALAEDFAGIAAYMDLAAMNALLQEGDRATGAHLSVKEGQWAEFLTALKGTPRVAGVAIKDSMRESFRSTTAENIGVLQSIYLLFALVVACGIVYNSARIALSERTRELATMRVMGFSQREVGTVLVGELVMLALLALPLGLLLGSVLARAILAAVNTETVRLPLILTSSNYAYATLVITLATAVSATLACRKLNRLDLVGVLKARD